MLFIFIPCLLIGLVAFIVYQHNGKVGLTKLPPASLAQWYKPENKRQVWLHNMFKLRREMQAVEYYAETGNDALLNKWATRLNEHYLKIGDMVPEWQKMLNIRAISDVKESVQNKQFEMLSEAMNELSKSCDTCHDNYRATTATLYRAPDFSTIEISPSISLVEHMDALTKQVNQIKITSEDGMTELALASLSDLSDGINTLGSTCINCHKSDKRIYPDEAIKNSISQLKQNLKTGTLKDQGQELGTLAVIACARCHGTHRISYDEKSKLAAKPNWDQLLKH